VAKRSRTKKCKGCNAGPTKPNWVKALPVTGRDTSETDSDSVISTTTKSLEIVEWRDANSDVPDKDWTGDYINATVGWTEEDGQWLKITQELTPDGERGVTRVPLVNVTNRALLKSDEGFTIEWDARDIEIPPLP